MIHIHSAVDPAMLLLVINRREDISINRTDLSPGDQYLQCATKQLSKGTTFQPHKHNELVRTTDITQEAWVFLKGRVAARFWDVDDTLIYETELCEGDAAIVFRGVNRAAGLDVKSDRLAGESLDKDLHSTAKTRDLQGC